MMKMIIVVFVFAVVLIVISSFIMFPSIGSYRRSIRRRRFSFRRLRIRCPPTCPFTIRINILHSLLSSLINNILRFRIKSKRKPNQDTIGDDDVKLDLNQLGADNNNSASLSTYGDGNFSLLQFALFNFRESLNKYDSNDSNCFITLFVLISIFPFQFYCNHKTHSIIDMIFVDI